MYQLDYNINKGFNRLVEVLVQEFTEYLVDHEILNITSSREEKITNVVKCWILNSFYPIRKGRSKIHLTLNQNHYSKHVIVNGRDTKRKISYTYTMKLFDFLYHESYIDVVKGGYDGWGYVDGKWRPVDTHPSYAVAETKLIELYMNYENTFGQDPMMNVLFLRDKDGKEKTFKMNTHKQEVRGYLQDYNTRSLSHTISLDDIQFDVQSYKVYNETLTKGGRTYIQGGSIQQLSKEDRSKLVIDGYTVVRLDYKGFEPSIAYQMLHLTKPMEDPYDIDIFGIDKSIMRDVAKKALLIMFNTESYEQADKALISALRKTYDAEALYESGKLYCPVFPTKVILDKLEEIHYQIRDCFYCNFGYELQYAGGLINDYVMNYFLQNTDYLVVQVFDEFIAPYVIEDKLRGVMKQGFEMVLGSSSNCTIRKEK